MQIMIVDDEQQIRDRLVGLKEWERIGCTVVGEAGNGKEALEAVSACRPDLIITDIRMPVMDGIQFAESVRTLYPSVQIIFISAYSDFGYAKQALKLGAVDFITKPIVVSELVDTVELLHQGVHRAERDADLYQENMIRLLLSGKLDEMHGEDRNRLLPLIDRHTILYSIEADNMDVAAARVQPYSLLTLKELVCDTIARYPYPCWTYIGSGRGVYAIVFQPDGSERDMKADSLDIARKLVDRCKTLYRHSISIGISSILPTVLDLHKGMLQIQECWDYRMLLGEGSIIACDSLAGIGNGALHGYEEGTVELMGYLRRGESERIPPFFRGVYRQILANGLRKIHVQRYALDVMERAERVMSEYGVIGRQEEPIDDRRKILGYDTLSELMKFLEHRLSDMAKAVAEASEQSVSGTLKSVMKYLHTHCKEEITLVSLSRHLHLNHSYLCRLIKKETGVNFRDLLWRVRIEKAKKLLAGGETRTFDIAFEVGFKDPSHFSQLFKRLVGVTPKEYRESAAPPL